ncbi:MAG: glycine cleavage system aminomethyltransferase GcvT, partial [Alphaproteobacteria bacterium]|nr:glycine cleavage system aminomethyltransferase GcvT [Alphaproteobacteria bacterium]
MMADRALIALQGPMAESVLSALSPDCAAMSFMDIADREIAGVECIVSRSGYTGEDGYEISLPANHAIALVEALLATADTAPVGLGARDSLRLEAGLCLYGADLDETTTPVEAALSWAIQKTRRTNGATAGGFPGDHVILDQLRNGTSRIRVGLKPEGRAPVRGGILLYANEAADKPVGTVTSGGFGPTVGHPVAMGYVPASQSTPGTRFFADVRGKRLPVVVTSLPFITPNYKR